VQKQNLLYAFNLDIHLRTCPVRSITIVNNWRTRYPGFWIFIYFFVWNETEIRCFQEISWWTWAFMDFNLCFEENENAKNGSRYFHFFFLV